MSDSDIEECDDTYDVSPHNTVNAETILNTNKYDFFTQFNCQEHLSRKKKRAKKKDKSPKTIVDIVTSEMAVKPLILENIITYIDDSQGKFTSIERSKKIMPVNLYKRGYETHSEIDNIRPIFPRVLENAPDIPKEINLNTKYLQPVMFSEMVLEFANNDLSPCPKFLDIVMQEIQFSIHHKFSLENLLNVKLKELYQEYEIISKSIIESHKGITVYRITRDNIRKQLLSITSPRKDDIRFDKTVLKYTKSMLDLKDKYYRANDEKNILIHKLLTLWADIKTIRDKQDCSQTASVLEVTNIELDENDFEKQWTQIFEEEFTDMLVRIEYDFVNDFLEYKEAKRNGTIKNTKKILKPKLQIDNDEITSQVNKLVSKILSRNKIEIQLRENKKVAQKLKESENAPKILNFLFKIYVDDIFVCESDKYIAKHDYSNIFLTESLSIQILPSNNIVKVVLLENDDEVSSSLITLSDIRCKINEVNFGTVNFIDYKIRAPTLKYIGSGYGIKHIAAANKVKLKSNNLFKEKLFSTFKVSMKIGWNEILSKNQDETIKTLFYTETLLNRLLHGVDKPNLNVITELINKIYDKDITEDSNIVNALELICNDNTINTVNCCFNENMTDVRFKLLCLRNSGKIFDLENITIPLLASQITTEQLSFLRLHDNNFNLSHFQDNDEINQINLKRFLGVKYIMKLNKNLMNKVNEFFMKKTFRDVVVDFQDLSLRSCFTNDTLFDKAVTSTVTKQQLLSKNIKRKQKIYVTVFKAYNLFDRVSKFVSEESHVEDNIAGYTMNSLRPFVKVTYRGECVNTPTAVGRYPTWNHTVEVKAKLEPLSSIHLNIYDECRLNISESDSECSTQNTVRYRKCNRWLGCVHVPLRTVLDVGTLRGTFKITSPPFLFGYENISSNDRLVLDPEINRLIKKETAFISLNITTDLSHLGGHTYNLPIPSEIRDDSVISHLNRVVTEYLNDFPNRYISLTNIDTTGINRCVVEFLQAIPVPDYEYFPKDPKNIESAHSKSSGVSRSSSSKSSRVKFLEDKESLSDGVENWRHESQLTKMMDAVVRYVSLIPTYELTESHAVALMGVELLEVLHGSPNDHAMLLASYFTYLGICCYVISGFGLPRGPSSYVLVKYRQDNVVTVKEEVKKGFWGKPDGYTWCVFDAVTGDKFGLRDAGCPLKTASYVFNYENIWVNVQSSVECENVSFDFSKSSDWQPVFGRPMVLTTPIRCDSLYSPPSDVEALRADLEARIKSKVQKWRSHVKTVWNRHCSSVLRETLPHWEYWALGPARPPRPTHRLKQLMLTYKMSGSPLNMPYVSPKLAVASVKRAAVHADDDPSAEFGLAVEVFGYPNDVLSLWVYLVSIVKIEQ